MKTYQTICCLAVVVFYLSSDLTFADHLESPEGDVGISLADVEPTPEMWFYSQERLRYDDPKTAVRRKAEYRAWQRQRRIALMKSMGLSKQRPLVYYSPFHTFYSPWNQYEFMTVPSTVFGTAPSDAGRMQQFVD